MMVLLLEKDGTPSKDQIPQGTICDFAHFQPLDIMPATFKGLINKE